MPGAETSGRLLCNVPLALLMVAGLRWLALNIDVRYRGTEGPRKDWRRRKQQRGGGGSSQQGSGEGSAPHKEGRWREKVRAPVVEHAWEMLCGSIIQQVRASLRTPGLVVEPIDELHPAPRRANTSGIMSLAALAHYPYRVMLPCATACCDWRKSEWSCSMSRIIAVDPCRQD